MGWSVWDGCAHSTGSVEMIVVCGGAGRGGGVVACGGVGDGGGSGGGGPNGDGFGDGGDIYRFKLIGLVASNAED